MDPILSLLLSWQFVLFGLAVSTIVYVIRIITEYIMSRRNINANNSKWWSDLVLPLLPIFVGVAAALHFKTFPYPDGLTTHGDRVIFGLVAGSLSTILYRVVNSLLKEKIQSVVQSVFGTQQQSNTIPSQNDNSLPPRGQP